MAQTGKKNVVISKMEQFDKLKANWKNQYYKNHEKMRDYHRLRYWKIQFGEIKVKKEIKDKEFEFKKGNYIVKFD